MLDTRVSFFFYVFFSSSGLEGLLAELSTAIYLLHAEAQCTAHYNLWLCMFYSTSSSSEAMYFVCCVIPIIFNAFQRLTAPCLM